MPTPDPHEVTSGAPRAGPEPDPGEELHPEYDAAAGTVGRQLTRRALADVAARSSKAGADGGLVALALGEGGESGAGEGFGVVGHGGFGGAVLDGHLLVGVADGQDDVPVGGEARRGEIEGGYGDGGYGELGEARAEDEPEDERDRTNDNKNGDGGRDGAAEEGGAAGVEGTIRVWVVGGRGRGRRGIGVGGGRRSVWVARLRRGVSGGRLVLLVSVCHCLRRTSRFSNKCRFPS